MNKQKLIERIQELEEENLKLERDLEYEREERKEASNDLNDEYEEYQFVFDKLKESRINTSTLEFEIKFEQIIKEWDRIQVDLTKSLEGKTLNII